VGEKCPGGETRTLTRINVVVEGQTEETFIRDVLAPEFGARGIGLYARAIMTGRKKGRVHRGGWDKFEKLQRDLILWMKEDANPDAWFTTMIDLYRLPRNFPGYTECHAKPTPPERAECLHQQLRADITDQLGNGQVAQRFVPYIQLHEFEALLFSEPSAFLHAFPDRAAEVEQLNQIKAECGGPENIDDGEETAPSKRILKLLRNYDKRAYGARIAQHIGLATLCKECPHFGAWISKLLSLAQ
jgi:hypothetical protein